MNLDKLLTDFNAYTPTAPGTRKQMATLNWIQSRVREEVRNRIAKLMGGPVCLWPVQAKLGEGPLWLEDPGAVVFVDIIGSRIHALQISDGKRATTPLEGHPSAILPRRNDPRLIVAMGTGLYYLSADLRTASPFVTLGIDESLFRTNDAKCDPMGRIWVGVMRKNMDEADGRLLIVDHRGQIETLSDGYTIPNGPAFNEDGTCAYIADSPTRKIYKIPIDDQGRPGDRTFFAAVPDGTGHPDGMSVDAEDHLWVAHYGGGRITRFAPDGTVKHVLRIPVSNVTSLTFGGRDLDRLYITTSGAGQNGRHPGGLFVVKPGVKGLPTNAFG